MQLIATRTYREAGGGTDDLADCDFLFRRADGSFFIEEAEGCAPHEPSSQSVEVSLDGDYDRYKDRPEEITRAGIDGGKSAPGSSVTTQNNLHGREYESGSPTCNGSSFTLTRVRSSDATAIRWKSSTKS